MRRRRTGIFFLILGISLSALAVALNIGWILLNLREVALLIFGVIFFALIITGLIFNTIFLVREIRRNEQQDAFLNAMTHELKTPIASIKLYLETLKAREVAPEKRAEFYDIMLTDSNRLLGTVEQVLQASRTGEKHRMLNLSEFSLNDLLAETVSTIETNFKLDQSVIKLTPSAEDVLLFADRAEIATVFLNLLDNAVKYSADEPKVTVRVKNSNDKRVEVLIKDNGIGLNQSELKRVFKRFYRAVNGATQQRKGTGLGLSIVESIVKKHGGRIWAESRGEGKGTTFIVQLPKQ